MRFHFRNFTVAVFALLALPPVGLYAQEGQDDAADSAYTPSWDYSDNGGTGFGGWNCGAVGGTFETTDSVAVGGDVAMNTAGRCFRLYAASGQINPAYADAVRSMAGASSTSDVLRIDLQMNCVGNNAFTKFTPRQNFSDIIDVVAAGSAPNLTIYDGGVVLNTGIPRNVPVRMMMSLAPAQRYNISFRVLIPPFNTISFTNRPTYPSPVFFRISDFFAKAGANHQFSGQSSQILLNNLVYDMNGDAGVQVPVVVSTVEMD